MEGRVETRDAVRRQSEPLRQPDIGVAARASVANLAGVDGGSRVLRRENRVLAVAVRANRGIHYAARDGFAVHAGLELFANLRVAHAAGVGDVLVKFASLGGRRLVGRAMAHGTIRRARVSLLGGLPMDAVRVVAALRGVAIAADGLWNVCRMRILLVPLVARGAIHGCVSGLGDLLVLLVAAGAIGTAGLLRK